MKLNINLLLLLTLVIYIFISWSTFEHEQWIAFGTIIYSPYAVILVILNHYLIKFLDKRNRNFRILNYLLTNLILLTWFILGGSKIQVDNWPIAGLYFVGLSATLLTFNLIGYFWNVSSCVVRFFHLTLTAIPALGLHWPFITSKEFMVTS